MTSYSTIGRLKSIGQAVKRINKKSISLFGLSLVMVMMNGCAHYKMKMPKERNETAATNAPAKADPLALARARYAQGNYGDALIACIDVAHANPMTPGLADMRHKVVTAMTEERNQRAVQRAEAADKQIAADTLERAEMPDTYGVRLFTNGETNSLRRPPSSMQRVLTTPVTLHLKGVTLSAVIAALATDTNINIVADAGIGQDKRIDVELEKVSLDEVLDYVARNLGVEFYVGKNVIWATKPVVPGTAPLETRIYHLRHGLQFHGGDWSIFDKDKQRRSTLTDLKVASTELSVGTNYIEEVIKRFIPAISGSELYLDLNAHILLARNTRSNLTLVEEILESLDVNPPQVLIEARFIETLVSDLRELGLDWVLDSPLAVMKNGTTVKTLIQGGNVVNFDPFRADDLGVNPLGPQGSFSTARAGNPLNPQTVPQGLNMTYQGVLTEPMFKAVLHAIDITGKGQTLSVPRVTTVNNNPAKLRNGEDLRYFEEFQAQAFSLPYLNGQIYTATVLIPKGLPRIEELGITLIAVPSVGADLRTVSLMLMPTISKLEGFVSYQESDNTDTNLIASSVRQVVAKLPIFSRKEVQTKAIVQSGETVVLGGLIDTVKQETKHGIPFLGSIPLLGKLFQRLDVTEEKRNLLIFVTATVISDRGETLVPH